MRITKKHLFAFVILSFFSLAQVVLFRPALVSATDLVDTQVGLDEVSTVFGAEGKVAPDIRYTMARIVNIVLGFLGVIFFGLTVFAGFQYMTAAGNEEQTKKALALLRNAIIGLVIILVSWTITRYITITLGKAVANQNYQQYNLYTQ